MSRKLRQGIEQLKEGDRIRDLSLKGYAAGPIIYKTMARRTAPVITGKPTGGRVSDAMRSSLRDLAQSDARYFRGMADATRQTRSFNLTEHLRALERRDQKRLGDG